MRSSDSTIHQRKVDGYYSEEDIRELLVNDLCKRLGFDFCPEKTQVKVIISKKEKAGTAGFESYAEVTLINDISGT